MARTPIPPRASADKNRRRSDRRNRCAMLMFSCFLLRTTGPVEVVLTDCTTQRYRIVSPEATPERKSTIRIPRTNASNPVPPEPVITAKAGIHGRQKGRDFASYLLVATLHGGYTVELWVSFVGLS